MRRLVLRTADEAAVQRAQEKLTAAGVAYTAEAHLTRSLRAEKARDTVLLTHYVYVPWCDRRRAEQALAPCGRDGQDE